MNNKFFINKMKLQQMRSRNRRNFEKGNREPRNEKFSDLAVLCFGELRGELLTLGAQSLQVLVCQQYRPGDSSLLVHSTEGLCAARYPVRAP